MRDSGPAPQRRPRREDDPTPRVSAHFWRFSIRLARSLVTAGHCTPREVSSARATALTSTMPVPVSVSGWKSAAGGGVDAAPSVMETSGPFAALAKRKAERESQGGVSEVTVSAGPTPAAKAAADAPPAPAPSAASDASNGWGVAVNDLDWSYPGIDGSPIAGSEPLIKGMDLKLKPGSCCLLLGANGAGKTTLLKILGGKHMVPKDKVLIHGREAFYDTSLTTSGQLSYIGGDWQRDVAFAGYGVTLAGDFPASKMLDSIPGVDPERKKRIIDVLDINPEWRMHQVSDGQRRRVQLAYGLMIPYSVLLLDEITVDLDVLGRADLMAFLRRECEERSVTIVYATHIFDGLEEFATHVAFVAGGRLRFCEAIEDIEGLRAREPGALLATVEGWLRKEAEIKKEELAKRGIVKKKVFEYARNSGWGEGRMAATVSFGPELGMKHQGIKGSSNAVMRN
jgi:CCR4-NOT complex subunit CAF16